MNALKTMRNMGSLKILLWIIVISFVLAMFTVWGTGGGSGKGGKTLLGGDYAVKVGDQSLPSAVFRLQYRFYVERVRQMLGDQFREDFVRGASQSVADGMVRQLIMAEMAKSYGLSVGDKELAANIEKMYQFRDPAKDYPAMVSRLGVTAGEFQSLLRLEMLGQKLDSLVQGSVYLSDAELLKLYTEQNEGVKATVAFVSGQRFAAKVPPASEAEIQARFASEKDKFQVPEKRALEYALLSPGAIRSSIKVDDAQVKAYYEAHKAEFSTAANQRRASHILIKFAEKAPAKEMEAAKKKAQELYAKAKAGMDFDKLAKEFSQDGSAAQGGDLGWFERTRMVKPFADAVFDQCQSVGEIVGPVQSQFGFHIIKLTGIGGQTKPYEEVKAQARQAFLAKDKGIVDQAASMYTEAEKALGAAKDDAAVKAVLTKVGGAIVPVTTPIANNEPIPGMSGEIEIQGAIAKAAQGQWSSVMKTRDGIIRFKVTSIIPAHAAKLEEVKAKVAREIEQDKALEIARAAARGLASAKDSDDLEKIAKKDNWSVQKSGLLKASDAIPGAGKAPEINKALMAAKVGDVVGPLKAPNGWVVAVVTEHNSIDQKKLEQDKSSFAQDQREKSAKQVMDDYYDRRKAELDKQKKIHYNQELLDQFGPAPAKQGGSAGQQGQEG